MLAEAPLMNGLISNIDMWLGQEGNETVFELQLGR
jgi:prophage maintenance system killer protein